METKTKTVNCRACGSSQISPSAARKPPRGAAAGAAAGAPSIRHTASSVTTMASAETVPVTATSRSGEKGSRKRPATAVVTMKPKIIISQTTVAAAGRRDGATRVASSASSEVPAAPTPRPISTKESIASASPARRASAISPVATAAPRPPVASTAMPPMIQGVRRPPRSEP